MLNASSDSLRISTIAVFLGGVGCKVGQQFWRQMQSFTSEDSRHTEVLLIDSEMPGPDIPELYPRKQHYYYKNLADTRTASFQDFADERFPGHLGRVPLPDTSKGAGITRAFAMASLAISRTVFEEKLATAYGRLRENMTSNHDRGLRIFVTASACGGTGAGMAIDAMAIIRSWFHQRGEEAPVISLFLVAPDVVIDDPETKLDVSRKRRMTASSYALMKELNGFASGMPFESSYNSIDRRIALDTGQPNQWLFDWVYLFNRKNLSRSHDHNQDDLAWLIAELQVHMTRGSVARRVNAIAPNIREQRVARYPLEFQANLQETRTADQIESMARNSLPSFLASMSIVSARFPSREIKDILKRHWVWTCLSVLTHGMSLFHSQGTSEASSSRLLVRGRSEDDPDPPVQLKISDIAAEVSGYLENIGQIEEFLREEIDHQFPLRSYEPRETDEVGPAEQLDELKRRIGNIRNLTETVAKFERASEPEFCKAFLQKLRSGLEQGFSRDGDLSRTLLAKAVDPNSAWGLLRLRDAIERMIDDKQRRLSSHKPFSSLEELITRTEKAQNKIVALERDLREEAEEENLRTSMIKYVNRLLTRFGRFEGESINDDIDIAENFVLSAHKFLVENVPNYVRDHAFAHIGAIEIEALKSFQERLDLMIQKGKTAMEFELAGLNSDLSHLNRLSGEDRLGTWVSPTTHNVGGDIKTLRLLQKRRFIPEQKIAEIILQHLNEDGIVLPFGTMSVHNIDQFRSGDLARSIRLCLEDDKILTDQLTQLDKGWLLPELERLLFDEVPHILDEGSAPLLRVSPASVNPKTDCWMIVPGGLELPDPFMGSVAMSQRFDSERNDTISVVQAMYGVPASTLHDLSEWFNDYLELLGDLTDPDKEMEQSRFPLHVFADGATRFPEIYQPMALVEVSSTFDIELIAFALSIGIIIKGPDSFESHMFPFKLENDLHHKLETGAWLDDEEWTTVRRFRLALAERIRRKCTERPKEGKAIILSLKSGELHELRPLLRLLQPLATNAMDNGTVEADSSQGLTDHHGTSSASGQARKGRTG
ncbi:tubulin-like doman-containing protein [Hoeflea sp. AS60]|uniref:tubulin-like doman-containing protein n=1 Tax=Hoeflea sp. AS60 TaxID=3135780 RepID=UPI003173F82D